MFSDKNKKNNNKIRKVYFGLRFKFLSLLCIVMLFVIILLTLILSINQFLLIKKERLNKASELTKILSSPTEFYLDKSLSTTQDDLKIKYDTIERETFNFMKVNQDIEQILIVDSNYKVRFSTNLKEIGLIYKFRYLESCLNEEEERVNYFDLPWDWKKRENKAVTYPIFLHEGTELDILNDYKNYFIKYHKSNNAVKKGVYNILLKKYKEILNNDFDTSKKINKNQNKEEISKINDVDFLFFDLFNYIKKERKVAPKRGEGYLWNDKWLISEKKKIKNNSLINTNKNDVANNDIIIDRFDNMYKQLESIKRLGALAIIFNMEKINSRIFDNFKIILWVVLIAFFISFIVFLIVINYLIKNLKLLEKWAIKVSEGNLEEKIKVASNDEIGRLSDIFNLMIDQLIDKFHLEKFVSHSTKKMINKSEKIDLGRTGKKDLAFIFSDVRGFTSFSEKNNPDIVIEVLNLYFELQAKIIKAKKGDIDDYVGDQIMAHFSGEKRADRAIQVAIEIASEIKEFNNDRKNNNLPYFDIGIGVHGGEVVVGNIGSSFRMDFACLGDAVNLTSRLCSNAEAGEILVSKELYKKSNKKYKIVKSKSIKVKGKTDSIEVISLWY